MLTSEEKKMLKVVAVYNDITEEQAKAAIVKQFLFDIVNDESSTIAQLKFYVPIVSAEKAETSETPKRKGGRPRKSVNQFVEEVHQADKMSKDEFVEYFGGK